MLCHVGLEDQAKSIVSARKFPDWIRPELTGSLSGVQNTSGLRKRAIVIMDREPGPYGCRDRGPVGPSEGTALPEQATRRTQN
jgi:hypothetical protein